MPILQKNHIRGDRDWEHTQAQRGGASFAEGVSPLASRNQLRFRRRPRNLTGPVRIPSLFARSSALRQLLPSAC